MGLLSGMYEHLSSMDSALPFDITIDGSTARMTHHQGGMTTMLEPMEGILLSRHQIKSAGFKLSTKGVGDGVKINYCISGRLEVSMDGGRTLYMGPGDLSVETSTAWDFSFPCDFYEGIELFLHRMCLESPPRLFEEVGMDLRSVIAQLGTTRIHNWTRRADDSTRRAFLSLFKMRRRNEEVAVRIGIIQLLLELSEQGAPPREADSTIFTRRQVDLAKQAECLLTDDLSQRRSIDSVASELGIKPTVLKTYFKGVYGINISELLSELRMEEARRLVLMGDGSIADGAHAVGFANAGKFSEAFRKRYGMTPLRDRKEQAT